MASQVILGAARLTVRIITGQVEERVFLVVGLASAWVSLISPPEDHHCNAPVELQWPAFQSSACRELYLWLPGLRSKKSEDDQIPLRCASLAPFSCGPDLDSFTLVHLVPARCGTDGLLLSVSFDLWEQCVHSGIWGVWRYSLFPTHSAIKPKIDSCISSWEQPGESQSSRGSYEK